MSDEATRTALLVLDQGTQASRALLFDATGKVLFATQVPVALIRPDPFRAEHNPVALVDSIRQVTARCLAFARNHSLVIQGAGLATQRSTIVAWDRLTGKPLSEALSWQDTRVRHLISELQVEPREIKRRTGLPPSPHYGASKLRWLLKNAPQVRQAAASGCLAMGPLVSFLLFHLVDDQPLVVDHSNASRTLLWNIRTRHWDPYLLGLFELDPHWLPVPSPTRASFGLLKGTTIPLTVVTGDQSAASVGHGPLPEDAATVNIGTGAFIMNGTDTTAITHPALLTGIADSDARQTRYCLEGTVNGAGAALRWAQTTLGMDHLRTLSWADVSGPPVVVNSVGGLGSPWWISNGPSRVHFETYTDCRREPAVCLAAIMESIVFMVAANVREMQAAGMAIKQLNVGGGLTRDDALCQRLADLLGIPVMRSKETEITARGVATLVAGRPRAFGAVPAQRFEPQSEQWLEERFRRAMVLIQDYGTRQ